jgi:hypothetical protein
MSRPTSPQSNTANLGTRIFMLYLNERTTTDTYMKFEEVSAVGIANGYCLEGQGVVVRVLERTRYFSSPRRPGPVLGPTQPPIQ